ncbi:MAG: hypothetical protein GF307_01065 [candidate division Zixibacteria bacterium]|nr:hypothetical protein [candidate division Zixibacteria bacterium]
MSNRKNAVLRTLVLASALFVAMIIGGCSQQNSPVSPENDSADLKEPFSHDAVAQQWGRIYGINLFEEKVNLVEPEDEGDSAVEVEIDAGAYEAELNVPSNAVDSAVSITAASTAYMTASGMVYVIEFGPSGLVFNTPATLSIEFSAIEDFADDDEDLTGAEIRYWNPNTCEWELQEVDYDIDDGTVDFTIEHFSRYGIGGRTL